MSAGLTTRIGSATSRVWARIRAWKHFRTVGIGIVSAVVLGLAGCVFLVVESMKVDVPDVVGYSLANGQARVEASELEPVITGETPPESLLKFTDIVEQRPQAGERVFPGTTIELDFVMADVKVPDLIGVAFAEASARLARDGLVAVPTLAQLAILDSDSGGRGVPLGADREMVYALAKDLGLKDVPMDGSRFPIPGSVEIDDWPVAAANVTEDAVVPAGTEVRLVLELPIGAVPDVEGLPFNEAREAIALAGFAVGPEPHIEWQAGVAPDDFLFDVDQLARTYWSFDEASLLGELIGEPASWPVTAQSTQAGQVLRYGARIQLRVDWPTAIVPDLTRMTLEQAREALHSVGLSAKGISGNGLVQSQAVAPGAVVPLGMQVAASLSHEVTFLVTSSASSALVTWTAPGSFSIQQDNGAALPWSVTFSRPTTPSAHARGVISAQMDAWDGWITCEILVDGKTVETQTSTGAFAIVMCG